MPDDQQQTHASRSPGAGTTRRVLITGGAGFIGSHLAEHMVQLGHDVTVIDDLSTGRRENIENLLGRIHYIEGDLARVLAEQTPAGPFDQVYHLAAAVGVKLVLERPIESIRTNIDLTERVLEFASRHSSAVLIASSSEVYGKGVKTPFAEEDDVVYGPTTRWRWSYAATKAIDEYLALAYAQTRALPVVVARFFNTVGPRQIGTYGMVLPNFVRSAIAGEPLRVFGDGQQSRCFCDVRDVAPVLPKLLDTGACHGRVFNIGSDRSITILELARRVIGVLGSRSRVEFVPYDRAYNEGFEDLRTRQPDLTRVRETVGFAPAIPLEQTIQDVASAMEPD